MGVKIGSLITSAKEISLPSLARKVIGIDGQNVMYQFLARIRKGSTGEPLRDREGRVTSHLSGIFYRISNFLKAGVKPLFVWDGTPPQFKKRTIRARKARREAAVKKWVRALEKGEEAMVYAQASSQLTPNMVEESIQLLDYMGVPSLQAPSEGEAQLAMMAREGAIWASASQDWDSLLFNSPRLLRNLSITGRRKLPRKSVYVETKPEIIELEKVLHDLDITQEQLIIVGILVGTDFNPGVKGFGPKKGLRLVRECRTLNRVLTKVGIETTDEIEEIFHFFLNPPTTSSLKIEWKKPDTGKLIEFMVDEHDFSQRRVEKVADMLHDSFNKRQKPSLDTFFHK